MNNPRNEVNKPYTMGICEAGYEVFIMEEIVPLINLLPLCFRFILQDLLCSISPSQCTCWTLSVESRGGTLQVEGGFLPGSWSLFLVPAAPFISSANVWGGTASSPRGECTVPQWLTDPSPDPVTTLPLSFHCRHHHSEPQAQNRVSTPSAHSLGSPALERETSSDILAI